MKKNLLNEKISKFYIKNTYQNKHGMQKQEGLKLPLVPFSYTIGNPSTMVIKSCYTLPARSTVPCSYRCIDHTLHAKSRFEKRQIRVI